MESFAIKNLTFFYPNREKPALDGLTLSVKQGEFLILCGPSGSGKTTLLRQLKPALAPHGRKSGEILWKGTLLERLDHRTQSAKIGFVLQSPEDQIVTDKVWHELAFGLESLGYKTSSIRLRVAEMASFFGIQDWFYRNVSELSGGQKQLLNLASVMVMQPDVLILDEPTSQLDPIAAEDFLSTIGRINRELGVTVIMTEHRLEEVLPVCDRVVVMDGGRIICDGNPKEVGRQLKVMGHRMFLAMPVPMRIWAGVENELPCPVTEREGRLWLDAFVKKQGLGEIPEEKTFPVNRNAPCLTLQEVWFRYEREGPDVIKGLSLQIYPGELYAVLGGNGTGKTTTLSILSGINRPYRGTVQIEGRPVSDFCEEALYHGVLGVLPQDPRTLFICSTVESDLRDVLRDEKISKDEKDSRVRKMSQLCRLEGFLSMHPYDLSGGEQQRAAMAKVLLLNPKILLLDEPTKGMDIEFKQVFAGILYRLMEQGVAVVMASHDLEFCARYATRCALFFDGSIVSADIPRKFFSGNSFYTTAANRMARHYLPDAVTAEDVIAACGGQTVLWADDARQDTDRPFSTDEIGKKSLPTLDSKLLKTEDSARKRSSVRILPAALAALAFLLTIGFAVLYGEGISAMMTAGDLAAVAVGAPTAWRYALTMLALVVELGVLLGSLRGKGSREDLQNRFPENKKLPRRTLAAMAMVLAAVPGTIFIGVAYLGDRKYYFISMLILLEILLPFVMAFEGRRPQARELIVIAVLSAIGVAGRAAFFMLPQFKPVAALVILSGVAFGGETGFLVGAVTSFVSNIFFGQGPWTPWQMFAFGLIGFLAGILFRKGILKRNTVALCVFGGLAVFVVYGGIMNPASVLMFQSHPVRQMFYAAYLQGIPFDFIHAAATVIFLWLLANPMLEKLDRIKIKYGLMGDLAEK